MADHGKTLPTTFRFQPEVLNIKIRLSLTSDSDVYEAHLSQSITNNAKQEKRKKKFGKTAALSSTSLLPVSTFLSS